MEITFKSGKGNHKYSAILGNGKIVNFGDKRYQQYYDKIGLYKSLNHLDKERRRLYRKRHQAILNKDGIQAYKIKYSPAWFSYHYLW
jgi:hypothetical protein